MRLVLSLLCALALPSACSSSATHASDAGRDITPAREAESDSPASCPVEPPTPGAVCGLPTSFECSFGDPCSFDRFACQNGSWAEVIQDGSAPETCPDAAPSTGSTCAACGKSYRCLYEDPCGDQGETMTTSICSGGHWLTGTGACDGGTG